MRAARRTDRSVKSPAQSRITRRFAQGTIPTCGLDSVAGAGVATISTNAGASDRTDPSRRRRQAQCARAFARMPQRCDSSRYVSFSRSRSASQRSTSARRSMANSVTASRPATRWGSPNGYGSLDPVSFPPLGAPSPILTQSCAPRGAHHFQLQGPHRHLNRCRDENPRVDAIEYEPSGPFARWVITHPLEQDTNVIHEPARQATGRTTDQLSSHGHYNHYMGSAQPSGAARHAERSGTCGREHPPAHRGPCSQTSTYRPSAIHQRRPDTPGEGGPSRFLPRAA